MLSNRIEIKPLSADAMQIHRERMYFYRGYAVFVRKALKKPLFQRFLRWLLNRENINKQLIEDVQIRVLPHRKENGNSLAGRRSKQGDIFIFPKSFEFYRGLVARHGNEIARSYIKGRAWATLIHEILHAKYSSDEEKVRKLTEKYLNVFTRNGKIEGLDDVVFNILFEH